MYSDRRTTDRHVTDKCVAKGRTC